MRDVARLLELRDELPSEWRPLLTRAAGALAAASGDESGCARCRAPIDQLGRGRPRRYCTTCSPRKSREKGTMAP